MAQNNALILERKGGIALALPKFVDSLSDRIIAKLTDFDFGSALDDLWSEDNTASTQKKEKAKAPEPKKVEKDERQVVLVVDDSPTVRKLVSITLKKHGYHVIQAADGMEGLAKVNDEQPDLILLDITMPRLDGYQLCKVIKKNAETEHIPVIMLSGKDGFFDKVRGRMAGSTEYMTKPFKPQVLLQVVKKYTKKT